MRIVTQSTFGPPSVLDVVDVEDPRPGVDEVLVDVAAAGVNPVDIAVRSGNFPLLGDPPFTLGWDVAGTVAAIGDGVTTLTVGDDVLGLIGFPQPGNAYADRVVAPAHELVTKPQSLTTTQAAALPLVGLTAWQALVGIARVEGGQRVLIHRAPAASATSPCRSPRHAART